MKIATDSGGRRQTRTDGLPQATRAAGLAARSATWLRDEEAARTGRAPGVMTVPATVPIVDELGHAGQGLIRTAGAHRGLSSAAVQASASYTGVSSAAPASMACTQAVISGQSW